MKNNEFADLIEGNLKSLVEDWAEAVRRDRSIVSDDDLSEGGLRDHIPQVIEEICDILRAGETPNVSNTREARVSAYTRYRQDYRARDLVAEAALLRLTLLDCLGEALCNKALNLKLHDYLCAARTINMYLDEELRYGISVFSEGGAPPNNSKLK